MRRPEDSVLLIIVVGLTIAASFAEEPNITSTSISIPTTASVTTTSSITPTSSSSTTSTEIRTSTHVVPTVTTSSTHVVPTVTTSATHVVPTVTTSPTHVVPTVTTSSTHVVPTVTTSPTHVVPTVTTSPTHVVPTVTTSSTHVVPTVTTSATHVVPTVTTSPTHVVPTATTSPTPTPGMFYDVLDEQDPKRSCILFFAETIRVTFNYVTRNGTTQMEVFNWNHTNTKLNHNESYCTRSGHQANMIIDWLTTPTSSANQSLTFYFARQMYTWKLGLIKLDLNTTDDDFPNIKNTTEFHFQYEKVIFENEYERSYKCDSSQSFNLGNTNANLTAINVTVELMPVWRIQAFEFRKQREFGNARMCPQSVAKNIKLPAIVGGVLFLLLSAVIVVYIISRFRRRKLSSYAALN